MLFNTTVQVSSVVNDFFKNNKMHFIYLNKTGTPNKCVALILN